MGPPLSKRNYYAHFTGPNTDPFCEEENIYSHRLVDNFTSLTDMDLSQHDTRHWNLTTTVRNLATDYPGCYTHHSWYKLAIEAATDYLKKTDYRAKQKTILSGDSPENFDAIEAEFEYEALFFFAKRDLTCSRDELKRKPSHIKRAAPLALIYTEALETYGTWTGGGYHGEPATYINWTNADEITDTFSAIYPDVIYEEGETLIDTVIAKAKRQPLRLKHISPSLNRFLSIAYHMQLLQGDNHILLPVGRLSKALGCTEQYISNLRKLGKSEGLLEEQGKHSKRGKQATQFRFSIEKLSQAQKPKAIQRS